MVEGLKISVNPDTLGAAIILTGNNERVINQLRILCSNLSDNFSEDQNTFHLPWFELKRGLQGLARLRKNENLVIEYDEFTTALIKGLISDHENIKSRISQIEIDNETLKGILEKSGFNRILKQEQVRDAINLISLNHGANFSVPGAGKTTTILAVHSVLRQKGLVNKLFVVSPINAFISWQDEIENIFGQKRFKIIRLQKNHIVDYARLEELNSDVILVNYEKLRNDISELVPLFFKNKIHFILDESHRIKSGVNNISYNQIIKLADLAKRRDILSGTPMPQSYLDLEPQFDFLWPGERIVPNLSGLLENNRIIDTVNQSIEGLYVRTTKNELGLIDPIIEYKKIPMGKVQAQLYRLFKSEAARKLAAMDRPTIHDFRRIGRSVVKLLQAATNPMLLTTKDEYGEDVLPIPKEKEFWELLDDFQSYEKPVKIEYLKNRIKEITSENESNKVLVWSYFVRNILILEELLKEYNPVTIYGGVPSGSDEDEINREGRIRKFHKDPSCRILIANPQACGEGISLHTVCHHAIYLDRNFNAAYYLQSIDRIHRLGLEEGVETKIEVLISENTIDEILINRLNDKIVMMGSVLDDPYLQSMAYDPEDIAVEDAFGIDSKDYEALSRHIIGNEEQD